MHTKTTLRQRFLTDVQCSWFAEIESDSATDWLAGENGTVVVTWAAGPNDYWDGAEPQKVSLYVRGDLTATASTDVLQTAHQFLAGCTEARPQAARR